VPASTDLPIWQIHSEIVAALSGDRNRLVLVAPTGSGKTTQVPQMVLDGGLAGEKKIVVLQPRRVAARTVAARVAWERGGQLGAEVGYQIRFDDQTSLGTRICFVTEGILLRWLQDDRTLGDVGVILFDEFHERNLLSDVALALVKDLQFSKRPDLKIAVMSATLDAEPVADYLDNCPIQVSEGQMFPVQVHFQDYSDQRPFTEQAADAVDRIVDSGESGDILVFMPGMGEINSTIAAIRASRGPERLALIPLHGDIPPEEQDLAFAPNPRRKVVVATNVAETSVTIDGIRHVVDSGKARVARYDAERGISTLFLEDISRASADQRKGRAGRTAPGTCYRLWTESGHLNRPDRNTPEIQRSDLAEVVLLLHSLGIKRAAEFDWLDKPDKAAVERAEQLLRLLGALRNEEEPTRPGQSDLTPIGRQMLRLPMHPRYSRMLVEAAENDCVPAAALCAAMVSGRDLLMRLGRDDKHISEARELFEGSDQSDFYTLIRAFQFARKNNFAVETCRRYGIHGQTARQVAQTFEQLLVVARQLRKRKKEDLKIALEAESASDDHETAEAAPQEDQEIKPTKQVGDDPLLRCIMAGFIDQLCIRRDQGTLDCEMTEGRTGTLMRESVVQTPRLFVAASIREVESRTGKLTLLGLATAIKREWVEAMFPQHLRIQVEHLFDRTHKRVAAVKLVRFRDLVIDHEHQKEIDPVASGLCIADAYTKKYFELPLFNHELKQFIARVNLITVVSPELEFPPFDPPAIRNCLANAFHGLTLVKEAQAAPLKDAFLKHLAPEQLSWLDELAPLSIAWPDGRKLKLLYAEQPQDEDGEPQSPEVQVKLHESLQVKEHPHICEGKLPVKMWLCAPDGKRIESTFNWPAFKSLSYPKLRPTLAKKYPGFLWL
jgi:ATP-dependent helicase HrpB